MDAQAKLKDESLTELAGIAPAAQSRRRLPGAPTSWR